MVLIPEGGEGYRSIRLVEVICKVVAVILNCRFTAAIAYHNCLHGFRAVCGTGTATLEVKMLQQVTAMREAVLHAILMDLHKAYGALGGSTCLGIMEGYGMGTRSLRILQRYWERLKIVAREGGYYTSPFCGERGYTQVNPLLPTIFNVVVDAVVRHW